MTEARRQQINAAAARYYRKRAAEHAADGLTTRGTVRKYRRWPAVLLRSVRQRIERRDLVLNGLTTRGTFRKQRVRGGLDRNARLRLHTAALNAIGLSARRKPL
jgi:hypothetical protein